MTPEAIKSFQTSLGVPATGVIDAGTVAAMNKAVSSAIAANKDIPQYVSGSDPTAILDAYMSGDWSGVTDLTGKPFTDEQQQAAVAAAEKVLGPAYEAQKAYDTANTEDTLRKNAEGFQDFQDTEKRNFIADKENLDQSAADNGVLFSGARVQKLRDLGNTYADREAAQRRQVADSLASSARAYQYTYGNDEANKLSDLYRLPGSTGYNSNVPGGGVARSTRLSSVYTPSTYNFQGTAPVAQKAATQVRAATQLANRANKLSLSGYGTKF